MIQNKLFRAGLSLLLVLCMLLSVCPITVFADPAEKYLVSLGDSMTPFLEEVVKDTAERLYHLAKSGDIEALKKIVAIALEHGLIDEAQAELIKAQRLKIYVAVDEQDDEAIMNSCKKLAVMLYDYGCENGYVNDEIHVIVTEAIRIYRDVKDMDEDEIIEYAKDYITTLLDEHDTVILDAVKLFAIEQGWVTENELSAFTAKIYAVKVAVESQNAESLSSAVKDLAVFLSEVYKAKEPALEALKAKHEEPLYNATHGEYTYGADSYYVALGGGTVYGTGIGKDDDGYYDLIVEELKLDAKTQFKNLGEDNLMINDLLNYVAKNNAEIAKADFITYQMDATAFILAVLVNEDPDWTKYLTDDEIAFVDKAVQAINANVQDKATALFLEATLTPYKSDIEKLLFASVAYAVETAKAVDLIEEINPEATLVVVGMYNPLKDFTVKVAGEEVNIGEYTEYVVDATNAYYALLAMADGGFTFVPVPDTTINGVEDGLSIEALDANGLASIAGALLKFNKGMYADVKGHDYIFTEIMDAVDVSRKVIKVDNRTKEEMGEFDAEVTFGAKNETAYVECDEACVVLAKMEDGTYVRLTAKSESENKYSFDLSGLDGNFILTVALKGDYNLDGKVSTVDVARANKALVDETEPSELQKYVFDMNGDNGITTIDVAKVNRAIVTETPIEW